MDHAFEAPQLPRRFKDNIRERLTIQGPVGSENTRSERSRDVPPRRFAGLDDLPGQLVCVDDDGAAAPKHGGDGALAGRHTAGKSDEDHDRGPYHEDADRATIRRVGSVGEAD
jgi:hypothetical protein